MSYLLGLTAVPFLAGTVGAMPRYCSRKPFVYVYLGVTDVKLRADRKPRTWSYCFMLHLVGTVLVTTDSINI